MQEQAAFGSDIIRKQQVRSVTQGKGQWDLMKEAAYPDSSVSFVFSIGVNIA
jgi:hypothetical protein